MMGTPDPISAGTAGDAALWGGSIAAVGMAANPRGAHPKSFGLRISAPAEPPAGAH